jgi:hypothetical protein
MAQATVGIKPTVDLWSRDGSIPFAASQDDTEKTAPWGPVSLKLPLLHPATPPSSTTTILSYEFKCDLNIYLASKVIILLGKTYQEDKLLDCICVYEQG